MATLQDWELKLYLTINFQNQNLKNRKRYLNMYYLVWLRDQNTTVTIKWQVIKYYTS